MRILGPPPLTPAPNGSKWPIAPFPGLIEWPQSKGNRTTREIGKTAVHEV
jgi:hypothetical protein